MTSPASADRGARQWRSAHTYAWLLTSLVTLLSVVGSGIALYVATRIPASRWALAFSGTDPYLGFAGWATVAYGLVFAVFISVQVPAIIKAHKEARAFAAYRP